MRQISIEHINGNEVLARAIFDINGRKLLNIGVSLSPGIVQKLYEKGISSVYVDDEFSEGIEINGVLCDETKEKAKLILSKEMQRLIKKKEINLSNVNNIVDSILDEVLSQDMDIIHVKDIRMQNEKIFAHSVNVCVMAIALATKLSLSVAKVKSIAAGALIHDLGKAFLPAEVLNKTEALTEPEIAQIRKHPFLGYNMVKDSNETSAVTKISILMHHENINGSGYPMGLAGDKIHYSARIITICNKFDSAVNDKMNKNILHMTDAIDYLVGASGYYFDKAMVDEFIKIIPVYSEGSIVLLSDGALAIVVKNNPVNLTRPVVRMFYNTKTKMKYNNANIIDLKYELSIKIIREIKNNVHDLIN